MIEAEIGRKIFKIRIGKYKFEIGEVGKTAEGEKNVLKLINDFTNKRNK